MLWTVYDVWITLFDKFLISNENQQRFVVSFKKPVFERVRAAGAQPHPPPSFPWRFIFSPTLHPNNSTWINCRIVADLWYSYLTIDISKLERWWFKTKRCFRLISICFNNILINCLLKRRKLRRQLFTEKSGRQK